MELSVEVGEVRGEDEEKSGRERVRTPTQFSQHPFSQLVWRRGRRNKVKN